MSMTPEEAAAALKAVEDTSRRTKEAIGYGIAAPMLILWGVIWLLGFGVGGIIGRPEARWLWPSMAVAGTLISLWLGWRARGPSLPGTEGFQWLGVMPFTPKTLTGGDAKARRTTLAALLVSLYGVMWLLVLVPRDYQLIGFFWASLAMLGYVVMGLFMGRFFLWVGLSVTGIALFALKLSAPWYDAVMALAGGGALIGGGLYLLRYRQ